MPPALGQIADHVLLGRSTVRLQQLVRAGAPAGGARPRSGATSWVNASQYAVLVTDLTETEEERCTPMLILNNHILANYFESYTLILVFISFHLYKLEAL